MVEDKAVLLREESALRLAVEREEQLARLARGTRAGNEGAEVEKTVISTRSVGRGSCSRIRGQFHPFRSVAGALQRRRRAADGGGERVGDRRLAEEGVQGDEIDVRELLSVAKPSCKPTWTW